MLAFKSKVLEKIEATPVKTAKKVALAYSGGLDSSLCAVLAKEKYKVEDLLPITVDVGQGQDEMDAAIQKAKVLGITPIVVDVKDEFANNWLAKAIQANSNYGAVFSIWDRLFGTYTVITRAQHDSIVFGVRELLRRECLRPSAMMLTPWLLSSAKAQRYSNCPLARTVPRGRRRAASRS